MKSTCWDTCATHSIIKSGLKDTEVSIPGISVVQDVLKVFLETELDVKSNAKKFHMRILLVSRYTVLGWQERFSPCMGSLITEKKHGI